jgi:hypothetical protein
MLIVIPLNIAVPLYREFRDRIALPLGIDQLLIMAALAWLLSRGLSKLWPLRSRFPELDTAT